MHISRRTVYFVHSLGHDIVRVDEILPVTAEDEEIVTCALDEDRTILTQDLDFSAIIALSGRDFPSVISLRLSSSDVDYVNAVLQKTLPLIEKDQEGGEIISVQDKRLRRRKLPITE